MRSADAEEAEIDVVGILRSIWRGKLWILAFAIAAFTIGWYQATVLSTPIYRAEATLALEVESDRLVTFESVVNGFDGGDAAIATEMEVIRSRGMMKKLVDRLNLTADPAFNPYAKVPGDRRSETLVDNAFERLGIDRPEDDAPVLPPAEDILEATVSRVQGAIGVTQKEWSYVLVVSAHSPDPEKAALLANSLADLYIEDRLEVKFEKTRQATAWLSGRVADLQRDVERSASELKSYLASADLINEAALSAMNLRLKGDRERLAVLRMDEASAIAVVATLEAAREGGTYAAMAAAADDDELDRLLADAEAGSAAARASFERRYDALVVAANREADRFSAQAVTLDQSVTVQQAEIEAQSNELVRVEQLEREAEANKLLYEYFLTRLKETAVQEGIQQADARVISPAVAPGGAYSPDAGGIISMFAAFGLILGTGFVLLREKLDNSIRTPEELEDVSGHSVVGQIPRIPGRTRRKVVDYLTRKPASAAVEAVRNLRTSLILANPESPPQVVMVTSALPGEGKTTTALALAQNYAGLGKKVLLVEADIRRRVFTDFLKVPHPNVGLLDVVTGKAMLEEAAQRPESQHFDVLLGSETSVNPADVLSSRQFTAFAEEARNKYDIVVFDTPPLLVVSDARVIGQSADAILMTVLWNRTSKAQVKEAVAQLRSVGLRISGMVLGNIDPAGMKKYGQGETYGIYSSYGRKYYKN